MKLELDAQKLEEARTWQQANFDRQVERVRGIMQGFLDHEIDQAIRFISYDRDSTMGRPQTHSDAAANITAALVQAVSNADLRGLNDTAGDLTLTISALGALEDLRAGMPDALREAWEKAETEAREGRDSKIAAEQAARDKKHAEQKEVP